MFSKNISLELAQKCCNTFCTNLAITIKFRVEFKSVDSLIQNMYVVGKTIQNEYFTYIFV